MFRQNSIVNGTYRIGQVLGRGGLGVVYLAWHLRLSKYVVLKRVANGPLPGDALRNEADMLKNLHHPYLPQVYDYFEADGAVYTVMDYVEGRDLQQYLDQGARFPQKQLCAWLDSLLAVLEYLAAQKPAVLHGDIKPGNIMLRPDGSICLIDFNISFSLGGQIQGYTDHYAAPELYAAAQSYLRTGKMSGPRPDTRSDIFSLAATFYHLASGVRPTAGGHVAPLAGMHLPYSSGFLRLLHKAMLPAPGRRWQTATAMRKALSSLYKLEGRYRQNLALAGVCTVLCAALLACGGWAIYYGKGLQTAERFEDSLATFIQSYNTSSADTVTQGLALLNDASYNGLYESRAGDKAQILHTLGDYYYYESGWQEAANYYGEALALASATLQPTYRRDYGLALLQAGHVKQAQEQLVLLGDTPEAALLQAETALLQNDACAALHYAQESLQETGYQNRDTIARAAICAANASKALGNTEAGLEYLARAFAAMPANGVRRQLAEAQAAQGLAVGDDALLQEAKIQYEQLCQAFANPQDSDRLNLATVYRALDEQLAARDLLLEMEREDAGGYRVPMQLAYVFHAMGDDTLAQAYCHKAETQYADTPAAFLAEEDTALMDELRELYRALTAGGN